MIGYNTLYKSMNGIKVVSDGISFISDGQAQHDDIIYNNFIKSLDNTTILNNNSLATNDINCINLNCNSLITQNINSNDINCNYFKVSDILGNILFLVDGQTLNKIITYVETQFNNTLSVINSDIHQTQTGKLYQQGTGENYLKDTYINGYLKIGSNLTQTGGSAQLKALSVDTITQNQDKGITQSGNVSNSLAGTTQVKNLIVTDSIIFPSNVEIPQTTTSDDILMNSDSVITQDITTITTKFNNLRDTRTQNLTINGNILQNQGNATATFMNLIIQGLSTLQGDITQTAGTTILKTLRCNNITLNDDQIITLSGAGYITQSGTGTNYFNTINLNSNANIIFNGNGIINQPINGINILSHFRSAGFGIIGGRNNTTYTNYQNIQNNNGLQIQFNRDNSTQYSFIMSNRGTGGNGGFRFQRYIGGVYLDEPLIIDDNITMNKNLSIPSGSISCSSATIGNISQTELNCLDNLTQNINDKFNSLDSQITNITSSGSNNSLALTGISYISNTDTTNIDNNVFITSGKNLLIGTINILNSINSINSTLSGISYNLTNDQTTINNHVNIPSGNNLTLGAMDVKASIDACNVKLNGFSYDATSDITTIDNNLTVNKVLIVNGMDIKAEITALNTSFTTGNLNTTDLATTNFTTTNSARFGTIGGNTFIKNDMRFCDAATKSENTFTQIYHAYGLLSITNYVPNGNLAFSGRSADNTTNTNYLTIGPTSFNIKNTPLIVDSSSTFNNTSTFNKPLITNDISTFNNNITANKNLIVNGTTSFNNMFSNKAITINYDSITTPNLDVFSISSSGNFVNVLSITVPANYARNIKFYSPISRQKGCVFFKLNTNNLTFTETLTDISCNIYKNGNLFLSNISIIKTNPLPITQTLTASNLYQQSYIYDIYFLNISVEFMPTFENVANTYDIAFNLNYSYSSNVLSTENFDTHSYNFNTTTPTFYTNNQNVKLTSTVSNTYFYASVVYPENTNMFLPSNNSIVMVDNINSNNIQNKKTLTSNTIITSDLSAATLTTNDITSTNITTANLTATNLKSNLYLDQSINIIKRELTGGYIFNNNSDPKYNMYPVICSIKIANPNDGVVGLVVSAGYKFVFYDGLNYGGATRTFDNSSGIQPQYYSTNKAVGSLKIYFNNVEITYPNIS